MNKHLRKNIVEHLVKKGNYSPDVDDYLIDMLIENVEFADIAKQDIKDNGLVQNVEGRNGAVYTKMNPAFGVYQMCLRNIHQTSAKLGISRQDRLRLKLLEEKTKDDFDVEFR